MSGIHPDPVVSIGDVAFDLVNRTVFVLISDDDLAKVTLERSSVLHGVLRCEWYGVVVDTVVRPVSNPPGPSAILGDDARRAYSQVRQELHLLKWQDYPLVLVDHVNELFPQEICMFNSRLVRPAGHGGLEPLHRPRRCLHDRRGSVNF